MAKFDCFANVLPNDPILTGKFLKVAQMCSSSQTEIVNDNVQSIHIINFLLYSLNFLN